MCFRSHIRELLVEQKTKKKSTFVCSEFSLKLETTFHSFSFFLPLCTELKEYKTKHWLCSKNSLAQNSAQLFQSPHWLVKGKQRQWERKYGIEKANTTSKMKIKRFYFIFPSCRFLCVQSTLCTECWMKKQKERKKKNYAVYLDTFQVLEFNETFSLQIP